MDWLGYQGGFVRSPLRTLDERELEALKAILTKAGIL
jgi:hypothetical protein